MAQVTKIEWTHFPGYQGVSWNPTRGCSKVSSGCKECYVLRNGHRPWAKRYMEQQSDGSYNWTGIVELMEHKLREPLSWRKPRCVFVNSTSDLFHESLPDEAIDKVFAVMALRPDHLFLILTKRSARMREYFGYEYRWAQIEGVCNDIADDPREVPGLACPNPAPLPNVALGVSVEDQQRADERILDLAATPAAVRFLSVEPMLGPVDYGSYRRLSSNGPFVENQIHWVICGAESGPKARPMESAWATELKKQAWYFGTEFFMKQLCANGKPIPFEQFPKPLQVRQFPEFPGR